MTCCEKLKFPECLDDHIKIPENVITIPSNVFPDCVKETIEKQRAEIDELRKIVEKYESIIRCVEAFVGQKII